MEFAKVLWYQLF